MNSSVTFYTVLVNMFFRGNGWHNNGNCVLSRNGLHGNYRSFTAVKLPRGNPRGKPLKNPVYRDRTHVSTCQKVTRLPLSDRSDRKCTVLFFFFFFFLNLTYSRWTSSLPSCLWSQRIFPSLPGSRLSTIIDNRCRGFSSLCVCVFFLPFILDIKFVGRTSRGHTGGRSHRNLEFSSSFLLRCVT